MGGAFLARADDATAASWNPAGLSYLRRTEFSLVGVHNDFLQKVPREVFDKDNKPVMEDKVVTEQTIVQGPMASQVAIKMLGTNGGPRITVDGQHPMLARQRQRSQ
mgnify:CR=1 FL=1